MIKTLIYTPIFFLNLILFGQTELQEISKAIVDEGTKLYESEMASWYGTDLFLSKYNNQQNIGGYFSCVDKSDSIKCVFFSNEISPNVIGTITFEETFDVEKANLNLTKRNFSTFERDLFELRNKANKLINNDSMFVVYENSNLNLIPIIYKGIKKVYVLTGPTKYGVVLLGNDYLITFDDDNNITSKEALHNSLIPFEYGSMEKEGKSVHGGSHSHVAGKSQFITVTDVCTLMLYNKYHKWKEHIVVSKDYINFWNCEHNSLAIIPTSNFNFDDIKTSKKPQKKQKKKRKKTQ